MMFPGTKAVAQGLLHSGFRSSCKGRDREVSYAS